MSAIGSTVGLGGLALLSTSAPALAGVLMPAIASVIFIWSSVAERSGMRSKGMARYNSAQAVLLTSRQEAVLAEAERDKAFLPFGAGLTGIIAAVCVTLSLFNKNFGEFLPQDDVVPVLLAGDDILLAFLAVGSVAGAVVTSDRNLCMSTVLKPPVPKREFADDESNEWQKSSLPVEARRPDVLSRVAVAFLTLAGCLLPLPLVVGSFTDGLAALWASATAVSNGAQSLSISDSATIEAFQELFDETAVVVSATAAAQAALVLLIAEKDFADAERRIAIQCKQAALSELFYAQSQAEAAVIPVNTAVSGAALGAASVAVEFSKLLGAFAVWPGVLSTFRSTLSSVLARVEADASWIELEVSRKGRESTGKRSDVLSSSLRELERLQSDLRADAFADSVRKTLEALPVGGAHSFRSPKKSRRRKVHLVAAELGMASQSVGPTGARVVTVTNVSGSSESPPDELATLWGLFGQLQDQMRKVVAVGLPEESKPTAVAGTLAVLFSTATPLVGLNIATLVLPLVTGSVGLLTVWQERVGTEACAVAKRDCALIYQRLARAEILQGRAITVYGGLSLEFAIASCGATGSVVCCAGLGSRPWLACLLPLALLAAVLPCRLAVLQQRRIGRYVERLAAEVGGPPQPRTRRPLLERHWWALPVALAVATPCSLPRRVAMACAGAMMQLGFVLALASEQVGMGELYTSRCGQVSAAADGWAQQAERSIRELPPYSAAATLTTLLSTAFVAFYAPASVYLPAVGLFVWIRALQSGNEARARAPLVSGMATRLQDVAQPSPWDSAASGVLARLLPAGQAISRPVRVTLLGARGLRAADFMGLSDPYCIGEVEGKPWSRTRTATVAQTCDPVWDHTWEVPDFSSGDMLSFSVFDLDRNGSDFLGRTRLSYSQLQSDFDGELPLEEAGDGISAFLRVRVSVPAELLVAPGDARYKPAAPWAQPSQLARQLPQSTQAASQPQSAWQPMQPSQRPLTPASALRDLRMWLQRLRLPRRTAALVAGLVEADMEPSSQYGPSPARIAVNSVQAQLDEIKLSVRTSESAWFGTLRAVALCTGLACASPFALSALATEVALPVLGAGLTLFVVSAEAQARTRAATSKVWAAEVSVVKATMEEMVAIACLFRARILAAAGFTAAAAVVAVVTESPWPLVAAYPRAGHVVQTCWQVLLAASCVGASVWCAGPLEGVLVWAGRASKLSAQKLREVRSAERAPGTQRKAAMEDLRRPWWSAEAAGPLPVLFGLLPLACAYLPPGRSFARRVTASVAASSFAVAVALCLAEAALSKAERATAGRLRTFALTDAFANEAEQQGALLPVASAATIALSGFITFGVEVNPYIAATLAISQAMVWVVASRKAVSTKFEAEASLQVNSVTESPLCGVFGVGMEQSSNGEEMLRRVKRAVLNFATMRR